METTGVALAGLLGRCPAMEHLRREVGTYGPSDIKLHIFGETGTGKENVARALHALSPRARHRFVPVNAAGFSDDLLASELFGHARGAFTGAVAAREGYVARAEGGTLFVDEVAELSPLAQARLLRFLQDNEYQRLGETSPRRADVRVISATNVDLRERVRTGRFRHDLWFRLRDDRIEVPPLRERGGDVLLLARHFLRLESRARGESPPRLTDAAERVLLGYRWPGNVRELESEMRRLSVRAAGRAVGPEDLSPELREATERPACALRETLRRTEEEALRRALERHDWVLARAAAELGITRQGLWKKLRRLGSSSAAGEGCYPRRPNAGQRVHGREDRDRTGQRGRAGVGRPADGGLGSVAEAGPRDRSLP
jgi:DNA-binding NtrC family response regulator